MRQKHRIRLFYFLVTGLLLIFNYGCKKAVDKVSTNQLTDKDGNIYNSVTIGTQMWITENLKTTKYSNGDASTNIATYGRLYTWYAVIDSRNICPTGWHVPTDAEWETLKTNLGGDTIAGGKLKETGTMHWLTPNTGANNETGFTALPGGFRTLTGTYADLNLSCWLWSSSDDSPLGWGQSMHNNNDVLLRGGYNKPAGVSVRCIKDI